MRITEKVVAASVFAMLAGCSLFGSKDTKNQPAPLVELKNPSLTPKVVWKYSAGKAGNAVFTPATAGDSVYVADAGGALVRLNAATGKEIWRAKTGIDLTAGVGTDGEVVVVGGVKGQVLAYDINGKQLWKAQATSEVLSSPEAGGGVVIVRSVDNMITAYDAKTGDKKWNVARTTPALTLRNAPGMVINGPNAYIAQPGGKLLALALAGGLNRFEVVVGEPRGATELERVTDIAGTPVIFEKDVCAVSYQGRVACFDATTGAPHWSKATSSDKGVAVDQRFVFVSDENGAVAAYSRENGANAWKNDKLSYRVLSTPVSYGRAVAVGDYQGYIHFLSREDGAFIGRVATDGSPIQADPIIAGTNLIFQTQSGTVTALAVE
ncbi:outer membrane protein assembly factor BamB [Pseudoduganella sp. FT25W]|jgi:outer membrane protein assembly factor BamB|uniref:Outer membrane protein assembly factor BamB n=1 Tax=Duganella alba TaxID=2666081 RepID=A0A6L5QCN8_9BURK|nr:outer membrane protein assembly factor BamB [Duganella alba]MRX07505.1 outer membrane protein assembly factor BamB [Duganella alba]MRX15890.1 outer membrane protein assembly factor BamB [Duganella alba]